MFSDQELISNILNNDSSAFQELVNRYQPLVAKTCLGFVDNYADAEDITQEVFIEVFLSLSGYRGEAKLSTWLYRIAVNKSLNFIRQQNRHKAVKSIESFFRSDHSDKPRHIDIEAPQSDNTDQSIEREENKRILKEAINGLVKNQRIAFVLSKYHNLSYKEIAEIMDTSLSSVESLLFRARQNLQKKILKSINE